MPYELSLKINKNYFLKGGFKGLQKEGEISAKKQGSERVVLGNANSQSKAEQRMCVVMMMR